MTQSDSNTGYQPLIFTVNEAVNPLSIDPNQRVTPSGHEIHNGDLSQESLGSLGVSEIGVIPPPPMFSSPSPPQSSRHIIPPPKEHSGHSGHGGHHGVGVHTARGHDLSEHRAKGEREILLRATTDPAASESGLYSGEEDQGCDDEEDELEAELPQNRVVSTVPAKEPRLDAVPLKSALKKPGGIMDRRGGSGTPPSQTPPREKNQNSR